MQHTPLKLLFTHLLLCGGMALSSQTPFIKTFHLNYSDRCGSITEIPGGDIYMLGSSTPARDLSEEDFLLVKTDAAGNELWMKTFGGTEREESADMLQSRDGGLLLLGYTRSFGVEKEDIYLVKTDKDGNQLWQKSFGGTGNDRGQAIIKNRAGGYVITGSIETLTGYRDLLIAAIDEKGKLLWQRTYGGKEFDEGTDIIQTYDGGFLVCGSTRSFGQGEFDVYVVKTDANGKKQWARTYGGAGSEGAFALQQTHDGEYVLCGYSSGFGTTSFGIYLLKLDASGDTLWTSFSRGMASDVHIHDDGAYVTIGQLKSKKPSGATDEYAPYLLKTSPDGDSLWSASFPGPDSRAGYSFCRSGDGAYLLTGRSSSKDFDQANADDALLIKTFVPTDLKMKDRLSAGLFPNPNRGRFTVYSSAPLRRVDIFDSRGRLVFTQKQAPSNYQPNTIVKLPAFQPGIYYARVLSHSGYRSEAFVLY